MEGYRQHITITHGERAVQDKLLLIMRASREKQDRADRMYVAARLISSILQLWSLEEIALAFRFQSQTTTESPGRRIETRAFGRKSL